MVEFFQVISVIVSCVAIVMIVVLLIRESRITKKFELFQEKDIDTIKHLTREKDSLRSEILDKLSALTKEEETRQAIMSTILNKIEEEDKVENDIINLLEFKMKKLESQIEDKVFDRLNKFQQEIISLKDKVRLLEEKLAQ